jgi:hypothetical protein
MWPAEHDQSVIAGSEIKRTQAGFQASPPQRAFIALVKNFPSSPNGLNSNSSVSLPSEFPSTFPCTAWAAIGYLRLSP